MTRVYDNSVRMERARDTRRRILDAARSEFLTRGYAEVTIADLARAAEVSPQTVYNAVGGKAEVVKAVYDRLLAGDDEPVAMSDRPEFRAMSQAASSREFAAAYAHWTRTIHERSGAFVGILLAHGPGGDPVLEEFLATIETERRTGNTHALTAVRREYGLPRGRSFERALDLVWLLTGPEVHDRLVRRCRWSLRAYEKWLADELAAVMCANP